MEPLFGRASTGAAQSPSPHRTIASHAGEGGHGPLPHSGNDAAANSRDHLGLDVGTILHEMVWQVNAA
jgi:hypothetical protein